VLVAFSPKLNRLFGCVSNPFGGCVVLQKSYGTDVTRQDNSLIHVTLIGNLAGIGRRGLP
jgi:hypothetical protein